ncbi:MAG: riboflavin biosynthesis protein RibD [Flavobacteriales bacterium]|nr:riboflavin biosynthesis protein RibD [Flavobacteriales bacterium]
MNVDELFMKKCIDISLNGMGMVSPNPMVGCVIVHENKIVGKGYHKFYGDLHAERHAIDSVSNKDILKNSTLYVNLEPCSHHGKQPPCTDYIKKYDIPKVVIGCNDPHKLVCGNGINELLKNNISITKNVLLNSCRSLNRRFITFHESKRPYIILKFAKSADGYIAPLNQNKPFWMTSKKAKDTVHKWRSQEDAILVGRKTVEKDNPQLTVRNCKGKNPIRILIDRNLKTNKKFLIYNDDAITIIFNEIKSEIIGTNQYIKINFKNTEKEILNKLHENNIQSVLIEGGRDTINHFINKNLWDEARVFNSNHQIHDGIKSPEIFGKPKEIEQFPEEVLEKFTNNAIY